MINSVKNVNELEVYTGDLGDLDQILVLHDNNELVRVQFEQFKSSQTTVDPPDSPTSDGEEGDISITENAVYTYVNGQWGKSPRELDWSAEYLRIDENAEPLSQEQKDKLLSQLDIPEATSTVPGTVQLAIDPDATYTEGSYAVTPEFVISYVESHGGSGGGGQQDFTLVNDYLPSDTTSAISGKGVSKAFDQKLTSTYSSSDTKHAVTGKAVASALSSFKGDSITSTYISGDTSKAITGAALAQAAATSTTSETDTTHFITPSLLYSVLSNYMTKGGIASFNSITLGSSSDAQTLSSVTKEIGSGSLHSQIPTAKAVYNAIQAGGGGSAAEIITGNNTFTGVNTFDNSQNTPVTFKDGIALGTGSNALTGVSNTINNNSSSSQVPTAQAVYNAIKNFITLDSLAGYAKTSAANTFTAKQTFSNGIELGSHELNGVTDSILDIDTHVPTSKAVYDAIANVQSGSVRADDSNEFTGVNTFTDTTIVSGGIKFDPNSETAITGVATSIGESGVASGSNVATEAAVRDALSPYITTAEADSKYLQNADLSDYAKLSDTGNEFAEVVGFSKGIKLGAKSTGGTDNRQVLSGVSTAITSGSKNTEVPTASAVWNLVQTEGGTRLLESENTFEQPNTFLQGITIGTGGQGEAGSVEHVYTTFTDTNKSANDAVPTMGAISAYFVPKSEVDDCAKTSKANIFTNGPNVFLDGIKFSNETSAQTLSSVVTSLDMSLASNEYDNTQIPTASAVWNAVKTGGGGTGGTGVYGEGANTFTGTNTFNNNAVTFNAGIKLKAAVGTGNYLVNTIADKVEEAATIDTHESLATVNYINEVIRYTPDLDNGFNIPQVVREGETPTSREITHVSTVVNSSSTHSQLPTALAVWDALQNSSASSLLSGDNTFTGANTFNNRVYLPNGAHFTTGMYLPNDNGQGDSIYVHGVVNNFEYYDSSKGQLVTLEGIKTELANYAQRNAQNTFTRSNEFTGNVTFKRASSTSTVVPEVKFEEGIILGTQKIKEVVTRITLEDRDDYTNSQIPTVPAVWNFVLDRMVAGGNVYEGNNEFTGTTTLGTTIFVGENTIQGPSTFEDDVTFSGDTTVNFEGAITSEGTLTSEGKVDVQGGFVIGAPPTDPAKDTRPVINTVVTTIDPDSETLNNQLPTSGAITVILDGYVKSDELSNYVSKSELEDSDAYNYASKGWVSSNYTTTTNLESTYAKKTDIPSLAAYATQSWVTGKGYITKSTTALTNYTTTTDLQNNYVSKTGLDNTLSGYVTTSTLGSYVTSDSLTTKLGDYVTSDSLTTTLGSYATANYVNSSSSGGFLDMSDTSTSPLKTVLNNYVTSGSLSTTLSDYVTNATLSGYAKLTDSSNSQRFFGINTFHDGIKLGDSDDAVTIDNTLTSFSGFNEKTDEQLAEYSSYVPTALAVWNAVKGGIAPGPTPTGGGDVYKAETNTFTGSNTFTTYPVDFRNGIIVGAYNSATTDTRPTILGIVKTYPTGTGVDPDKYVLTAKAVDNRINTAVNVTGKDNTFTGTNTFDNNAVTFNAGIKLGSSSAFTSVATSVTSSSTAAMIPTAKAVWDLTDNLSNTSINTAKLQIKSTPANGITGIQTTVRDSSGASDKHLATEKAIRTAIDSAVESFTGNITATTLTITGTSESSSAPTISNIVTSDESGANNSSLLTAGAIAATYVDKDTVTRLQNTVSGLNDTITGSGGLSDQVATLKDAVDALPSDLSDVAKKSAANTFTNVNTFDANGASGVVVKIKPSASANSSMELMSDGELRVTDYRGIRFVTDWSSPDGVGTGNNGFIKAVTSDITKEDYGNESIRLSHVVPNVTAVKNAIPVAATSYVSSDTSKYITGSVLKDAFDKAGVDKQTSFNVVGVRTGTLNHDSHKRHVQMEDDKYWLRPTGYNGAVTVVCAPAATEWLRPVTTYLYYVSAQAAGADKFNIEAFGRKSDQGYEDPKSIQWLYNINPASGVGPDPTSGAFVHVIQLQQVAYIITAAYLYSFAKPAEW